MLNKQKIFSRFLINTLISIITVIISTQILNLAFKNPPLSSVFINTVLISIPISFIFNWIITTNKAYKELAEKMLSYEKITEVIPISANSTYSNFDIMVLPKMAKFYAILNREENCVYVTVIFDDNSRSFTCDKVSKEEFFKYYDILNA